MKLALADDEAGGATITRRNLKSASMFATDLNHAKRSAISLVVQDSAHTRSERARVECQDELIRIPGAIQPHGWLVALRLGSDEIVAFSENCTTLTGTTSRTEMLAALGAIVASVRPGIGRLPSGDAPVAVCTVELAGQSLDISVHQNSAVEILEFEPGGANHGSQAPIYSLARYLLPDLRSASSLREFSVLAVSEMKRLSGFGRCLAHKFNDEGNVEVLAELRDPGYDSYDGHRFPAMDIPAQARELYRLNHMRLIPNANYTPVPIVYLDPALSAATLDLSFASLRSVSPIHLEYMRNMGTMASMSVSIIVRGQLWGLISCHSHTPRQLSFQTRAACEHVGRLLSLQIESRAENAEIAAGLEHTDITLEIVAHLADSDLTLRRLVERGEPLLRMARATGAAVVFDDECWTTGVTPPRGQIEALARAICTRNVEVYKSESVAEDFGPAAAQFPGVTGVLAICLSQVHRHLIVWFRAEILTTIQWAGEPLKYSPDGLHLHPRLSFATWEERVRGRSLAWAAPQVVGAAALRKALLAIVLRHAQERAEVANEFGRLNKELEAFSYTVSHDLRSPMRHICAFVDLVLDSDESHLAARDRRHLAQVKDASGFAIQLVDALLDFSRLGRAGLNMAPIDTQQMVSDLVRELSAQDPARLVEWDIASTLPPLWGDPFLMQIVVRNLLSNALKYTRGRSPARIRVSGVLDLTGEGLEVSDNGVGFPMKFVHRLFGVFQRLHRVDEFEGTGIGLAIVRRVVERHGGLAWARGEAGVGASVGFTILNRARADLRIDFGAGI